MGVYKLLKAMYELRDAAASFDRMVLDVMNLMEVSVGKFSICVGYRKAMEIIMGEGQKMGATYFFIGGDLNIELSLEGGGEKSWSWQP